MPNERLGLVLERGDVGDLVPQPGKGVPWLPGVEEDVRPIDDVASARVVAVRHGEALELQICHRLDDAVMEIRRLDRPDRTGRAGAVRRLRHVDREGP